MKFKKIFFAVPILAAFLLAGCNQQKKETAPKNLTKTEVIKKSQKSFKSGQVIQSLKLSTDTSSQIIIANTIFGGESTVFHINNQTSANGKSSTSEQWVNNSGNVYLKGSGAWYKSGLEKLSGHTYADLLETIMNNSVIFSPDKKLVDAYKMKREGQTYTLTAKVTDQKIMKEAASNVFNTIGQSTAQEKLFTNMQKYGKYTSMDVKMVVKDDKLSSCNIFVNMSLGKFSKVRLGQSYGNFGSHDFLKLPDNALDAKPLPTTKTKK